MEGSMGALIEEEGIIILSRIIEVTTVLVFAVNPLLKLKIISHPAQPTNGM